MTTPTARAAAEAATATRRAAIKDAMNAHDHDASLSWHTLPLPPDAITSKAINRCRMLHNACLAHLDELERLIAQRDGYADAQSIGPDTGERRYG